VEKMEQIGHISVKHGFRPLMSFWCDLLWLLVI
jgi:hypothetical protein